MAEIVYGRTPQGQLLYDLAFTDLTPMWLAKKHKMPAGEIRMLRLKVRETMLKRRRLTKQQRKRVTENAVEFNKFLDSRRDLPALRGGDRR